LGLTGCGKDFEKSTPGTHPIVLTHRWNTEISLKALMQMQYKPEVGEERLAAVTQSTENNQFKERVS
jgi:hypothetical protein